MCCSHFPLWLKVTPQFAIPKILATAAKPHPETSAIRFRGVIYETRRCLCCTAEVAVVGISYHFAIAILSLSFVCRKGRRNGTHIYTGIFFLTKGVLVFLKSLRG
jgi:hypothetical protein